MSGPCWRRRSQWLETLRSRKYPSVSKLHPVPFRDAGTIRTRRSPNGSILGLLTRLCHTRKKADVLPCLREGLGSCMRYFNRNAQLGTLQGSERWWALWYLIRTTPMPLCATLHWTTTMSLPNSHHEFRSLDQPPLFLHIAAYSVHETAPREL
jgi:hypothetical protein